MTTPPASSPYPSWPTVPASARGRRLPPGWTPYGYRVSAHSAPPRTDLGQVVLVLAVAPLALLAMAGIAVGLIVGGPVLVVALPAALVGILVIRPKSRGRRGGPRPAPVRRPTRRAAPSNRKGPWKS